LQQQNCSLLSSGTPAAVTNNSVTVQGLQSSETLNHDTAPVQDIKADVNDTQNLSATASHQPHYTQVLGDNVDISPNPHWLNTSNHYSSYNQGPDNEVDAIQSPVPPFSSDYYSYTVGPGQGVLMLRRRHGPLQTTNIDNHDLGGLIWMWHGQILMQGRWNIDLRV
jgi:hypothetical protein